VIVSGRDEQRGAEVVAAITESGGSARFVRADLAAPASVQELARLVRGNGHGIDVLVNNAGSFAFGPTRASARGLEAMFATNVRAPFSLPQPWRRRWQSARRQGDQRPRRWRPMSACRRRRLRRLQAALELLTSRGGEYGPQGVNVNAIAPGPVRTPAPRRCARGSSRSSPPSRRPRGEATEIAAAAVFLASSDADYIHGATLASTAAASRAKRGETPMQQPHVHVAVAAHSGSATPDARPKRSPAARRASPASAHTCSTSPP